MIESMLNELQTPWNWLLGQGLKGLKSSLGAVAAVLVLLLTGAAAHAGEQNLPIPNLWEHGRFERLGGISPGVLLFWGSFVILGTLAISLYQLLQIHKQPAHKSMLDISEIIFQTCKTYLIQQGKFLLMLFCFIAVAMAFYLLAPAYMPGFPHEDAAVKEAQPAAFSPLTTL